MKKLIAFFILFFLTFGSVFAGISYVAWRVKQEDNDKFSKKNIIEILSKETLLLYSDGQMQLGSLFGQDHRIYVEIDEIPKVVKDAIISAEDESFYTNIGINLKGIARASLHNLFSRTRQGASTITQQTVKNLFGRKETDLVTKFEEMINAFKLEKKYSKDQILEFYLNQFHVTGNGRGIGVAAKYYFNKNVEDLNLVEAAFIAGSVKAPERYNPFTKTSKDAQEKALKAADVRKNYVVQRMYEAHKISEKDLLVAKNMPVPFNQGKFQFNELAIHQIIGKQLARAEILQAIGANSVDEIGTMGLRITTTIDKDIQVAAQYGLRQNLSQNQMVLSGFYADKEKFVPVQKPELFGFYVGKIKEINTKLKFVTLSFGLPECVVDSSALQRVAVNVDQVARKGVDIALSNLFKTIYLGEPVLASVKNITAEGKYFCDLEVRPKLQGASLVLDKGQIKAMVGGFAFNEYNRAIFAQRQPGSTFKIPVYYSALQLGWTVLDAIPDHRDLYTWQGVFYYPRPDHPPVTLDTTILGAAAKSENYASIWLLRHLTDKLTVSQFEDLLEFLNIKSKDNAKTISIIANKFNASADNSFSIKEGILDNIKSDEVSDFSVLSNSRLKLFIRTLHYGNEFEKQEEVIKNDEDLSDKEKEIRFILLKNNLFHWNGLVLDALRALDVLKNIQVITPTEIKKEKILSSFYLSEDDKHLYYLSSKPWEANKISSLFSPLKMKKLSIEEIINFQKNQPELFEPSNLLLDGVAPISIINNINTNLEKEYQRVLRLPALERLYYNADFRYSIGMYYTASMVNAMGVKSPLKWVPSFPLGSNDITLSDLSLMYQTFLTGKVYHYFNTEDSNQLLIIRRIEDNNGNLIWEAQAKESQFIDNFYSIPTLNAMRGTVTSGTANNLNWSTILRSNNSNLDKKLLDAKIRVPNFGKTGTTNNYTNATYIGFLPYVVNNGDDFNADNCYTIASYLGYDNNEPMVHGWYKIFGGRAIPAWQEIALSIIKNKNFAEKLNWESYANKKSHLIPFNFRQSLSSVLVGIHSSVSLSSKDPDEDISSSNERNLYANDYSYSGQKTLKIFLEGNTENGIFIPKRKVSFYKKSTFADDVIDQDWKNELKLPKEKKGQKSFDDSDIPLVPDL